jgi:sigma-E factor negative regulatory protein RseA
MTQPIRESLSALLDEEADELDLQRIINSMDGDDSPVATWQRYNLASASMRNELDQFANVDLSMRVRNALVEDIETAGGGSGRNFKTWLKPFASVAVAASVTAAILTSTQLFNAVSNPAGSALTSDALEVSGNVSPMVAGAQSVGFGGNPSLAQVRSQPMIQADAAAAGSHSAADEMARQRLEFYLRKNAENAALNTSSGMLPLARMAMAGGQ